MKKFMLGIAALIMGAGAAQAALQVQLQGGTNDDPATLFTFSDLGGTATFTSGDAGAGAVKVDPFAVSGLSSGSFLVDVTATTTTVVGAESWGFDTTTAFEFRGFSSATWRGWGVSTLNDATGGSGTWQTGEAFLLTFTTNSLVVGTGEKLVFSIDTKKSYEGDADNVSIYQRTGANSAVLVANIDGISGFSPYIDVASSGGYTEYAIVKEGTVTDMLRDIRFDIIGEIVAVETPIGLEGLAMDASARLTWTADTTGLLDNYRVYRSTVSDTNTYAWVADVTTTEYIDTNLVNGTTYYYAVTAFGTNSVPQESAYSDEISLSPVALSTDTVFLMHYDASQSSSVTLGTNGFVSVWSNLVSPGTYDATETWEGFVYPSTNLSATGMEGVDCTTNPAEFALMDALESDLLLDTTGGKSGFVVLMALRPDSINSQQDVIGNTSTVSLGFGLRWTGAGFVSWLGQPGSETLATTGINGDTIVVSLRFDVADLEYTAWESSGGNTFTVERLPIDYSVAGDGLNMGRTAGDTRDFEGQIFEVKIWGSTLDDATLKAEQVAMTQKWAGNGYDIWARQFAGVGAADEDTDNDGVFNIYEFGLGGNPTNYAVAPAVLPSIIASETGLEYVHVMNNEALGLVYSVETTTDLVNPDWTNNGYVTPVSITASDNEMLDTVTNTVDSSVESELFIRLKIQ